MPKEMQKVAVKDNGEGMFDFTIKKNKNTLPFTLTDIVAYSVSRQIDGLQLVTVSFYANVDMASE